MKLPYGKLRIKKAVRKNPDIHIYGIVNDVIQYKIEYKNGYFELYERRYTTLPTDNQLFKSKHYERYFSSSEVMPAIRVMVSLFERAYVFKN